MVEEIWRPDRLIGSVDGLQFALSLSASDHEGLAWGEGMVFFAGDPVWFAEGAEGQEVPLKWTWVDLLAFLGRWWPWILLEEDYPLPIQPLYPGYFLREAERRWLELPDDQVEAEEEKAHRFISRHDLAEAINGLFLPSLILLRQGNTFQISTSAYHTRIRPWYEIRNILEEVGDYIANVVQGSTAPRTKYALELWGKRNQNFLEMELDIVTGLSVAVRNRLCITDWQSDEIRAVARMSRGMVLPADQADLLARIEKSPRCETPELDRLSALILAEFLEIGPPYRQGYWAASRLRRELNIGEHNVVDPYAYLEEWGVVIEMFEREGCPVEAVTAWGERHGPVIFLNRAVTSRARHDYGQRATLAHEIAHLLLDRHGAMPAGEVLGGRTPEYPEKRARAFAAEFLLPQTAAEDAMRRYGSLLRAAQYLQRTYRVSTELLAWQIKNSNARLTLSDEDFTRLDHWITGSVEMSEG